MNIEPGTSATAQLVVAESDLASQLAQREGDGFPPVFSTARMISLMELAASRALHPALGEGELSVGVSLDVAHTAATPVGAAVTAVATLREIDGKIFVFDVSASDPGGEIGRGTHRRAIVASQRLVDKAAKRCGGAGR